MGIKDLFISPVVLLVLYILAYVFRAFFVNDDIKKYFIPALSVKFFGAIALGMVYQFYYGGGDTINYWLHGSSWIWESFIESPSTGLEMIFGENTYNPETYKYASKIWYFRDDRSFFIVRIAAFFDIITFNTYSATALFFSAFSFLGSWKLFEVVQEKYPTKRKRIAIAILFIPSVIFWGSGILKDTVTFGSLTFIVFAFIRIIEQNRFHIKYFLIVFLFSWVILQIKVYILAALGSAIGVWVYLRIISRVRSHMVKISIAPLLLIAIGITSYSLLNEIGQRDRKYAIENIPKIAAVTSYDIRYGWGSRTGGDGGYDIGELDGTWWSMLRLFPSAVNVSLFRPYLWEVKNPLMLLSALEAILVLFFTLTSIKNKTFSKVFKDPFLIFCLSFSILFAFAVGVSTFNFGTLMRYKIPLMPFWGIVLFSR